MRLTAANTKYFVLFSLVGIAQIGLAAQTLTVSWLIVWSGLSWVIVGFAYGPCGVQAFGKRPNGTMAGGNVIVLLPYLILTWLLWQTQRTLTREAGCHEIVPGLWLGRRPYVQELPPGVGLVVDLTCEFIEPHAVRLSRRYHCLPTLDTCAPSTPEFRELVSEIARTSEAVYVHCALGHGRSATVIIAVLIARGIVSSLDEAEALVKKSRPGIKISPAQRRLLESQYSRV